MQSELLKPLISHTGRTLNTVLPMRDYICQFDPEKLSQALFNLVSNALKFTEPDGHITLELKKTSASRLCIVVRDDWLRNSPGSDEPDFQTFGIPQGSAGPTLGHRPWSSLGPGHYAAARRCADFGISGAHWHNGLPCPALYPRCNRAAPAVLGAFAQPLQRFFHRIGRACGCTPRQYI